MNNRTSAQNISSPSAGSIATDGDEGNHATREAPQAFGQAAKLPLYKHVFSFPAMLGGLLVCAVFLIRRTFEVDPDLWWHLKVGESILATHHWPTTDPYSFTAVGQSWLAYEWLGDVLFAAVARVGGLRALQGLLILLGSAVVLALYCYATLRARNSKAGFLTATVLVFLAAYNFNLRPQMLGYLFLILTLIALERFRQGKPAALWFLPPLFLIWINTHGSWEIGLGLIFICWAGGLKKIRLGDVETNEWKPQERVRLCLVFMLCLAVIPITPYGTRLASYPFEVAASLPLNLAHIDEWQPMPLKSFGPDLFLALVLGTIALQTVLRLKWRAEDVVLFIGAAVMAFVHARFLLIFVPIFTPILATVLARYTPKYHREKDPYILNAVLMAMMLGGMTLYFPSLKKIERDVAKEYPVDAVNYLRDHPIEGAMFNSYGFGGYLVYSRSDKNKVFIDGRGELYERAGIFADYVVISLIKPGLLDVFQRYNIKVCLLDRREQLVVFLLASSEWEQVYADPVTIILVRRDSVADVRELSR